jgi:serine/threonine protein kinase
VGRVDDSGEATQATARRELVFISYRRSDAGPQAGRLATELGRRFGAHRVFFDTNSVEGGQAFPDEIRDALARSRVLLVVMGAGWLSARDDYSRRRIDDPTDWVRREIIAGLHREEITVIPVLVDQAKMPPSEALPSDLAGLASMASLPLEHGQFDHHAKRISERVRQLGVPEWDPAPLALELGAVVANAAAAVKASAGADDGPARAHRTGYEPYPAELVEELEELTKVREQGTPEEQTRRQQRITRLATELARNPSPADVIVGARLVRRLGKGSYGTVWQATDTRTGEPRAVKLFDTDRLGLGTSLYHFRRGMRAMRHLGAIAHRPNSIVQLHVAEDSGLAFSMDYLDGGDLTNVAKRGWSFEKKVAVMRCVSEAVGFAHDNGVIHRDIKPANIVMHGADPVLTDFDIADLQFAKTLSTQATGTIHYSAPEALNHTGRGPTLDIFSLGRLLHFLLREADPPIVFEAAPRLADIRGEHPLLARIIAKCTCLEPAERYQTVASLLNDLEQFSRQDSASIAVPDAPHSRDRDGPRFFGLLGPELDGDGSGDLAGGDDTASADSSRPSGGGDAEHLAPPTVHVPTFHSEDDLARAILAPSPASDGRRRRVVFLLGPGFTMGAREALGAPMIDGLVYLIEQLLSPDQREALTDVLQPSPKKYPDALGALASFCGERQATTIIREAVLRTYRYPVELPVEAIQQEKRCRECEKVVHGWRLPPNVAHLGRLIARARARDDVRFNPVHFTTNLDPLLAIAIRKRGGECFTSTADGPLENLDHLMPGQSLLVHLWGRWNTTQSLFTALQGEPRPAIEGSLRSQLERSVLVVLGEGWDDTLARILQGFTPRDELEVHWGFSSPDPLQTAQRSPSLLAHSKVLGQSLRFYRGIDSRRLLQTLADRLDEETEHANEAPARPSSTAGKPFEAPRRRGTWLTIAAMGLLVIPIIALTIRPTASPDGQAVNRAPTESTTATPTSPDVPKTTAASTLPAAGEAATGGGDGVLSGTSDAVSTSASDLNAMLRRIVSDNVDASSSPGPLATGVGSRDTEEVTESKPPMSTRPVLRRQRPRVIQQQTPPASVAPENVAERTPNAGITPASSSASAAVPAAPDRAAKADTIDPVRDGTPGTRAFDVQLAKLQMQLAGAQARVCGAMGTTRGTGEVAVIIEPWGRVGRVTHLNRDFVGTPVGFCVIAAYQAVQVPAFAGDSRSVKGSFTVE